MDINFDKTIRLKANIQDAVEVFTFMKTWLKVEKKYKKDNSGQLIEDGEQLAFNEHTNRSINEYLLCILWRLSPIVFHCADEEIHEVIEERYGNYSDSYKKLLLDIAREHNPKVEDIEQEFIKNLSSYDSDSINSLINIYRVQWKGHIPHVTVEFGYFGEAYNDDKHLLYNVLHEAEDSGLLDFEEIRVILDSLDWIAQTLKSIGESINKLFEKWQNTSQTGTSSNSQYTISDANKTDFIKIISAMYDCRMFETADGKIASNKKELIKALGQFFNTKIDDCSKFLSAAKNTSNYLDIFDKLKNKGKDYYEK